MKLPNAENAVIPIEKLRDYALNPDHERGMFKAELFRIALNLDQTDAELLRDVILEAVRTADVKTERQTQFGVLYTVDMTIEVENQIALVRTGWLLRSPESRPRLVTCYLK